MILGFYGDGKGKTSAALGTIIRALGAKRRVGAVFFMKNWSTSETSFLKGLESTGYPVQHYLAGDNEFVHASKNITKEEAQKKLKSGKITDKDAQDAVLAHHGLEKAREYMKERPFLLVLDELGVAVHFKLIKENEAILLIEDAKKKGIHVIITGKKLSPNLRARCDLITNMKNVKHPFDEGIYAIPGLDY